MASDDRPQIAKDAGLPQGKADYGPCPECGKMTPMDQLKTTARSLVTEGPKEAINKFKGNRERNKLADYMASHNTYSTGRKANPRGGD